MIKRRNDMKWIRMFVSTFIDPIKDFRVLGWTLLIGALAFLIDPQGLKMVGVVLYVCFFWMFALSIRKVLFPYRKDVDENGDGKKDPLKLSDFFKEAYKGSIAASIVVLAQIILMCVVALTFVLWIR
jgi:hypothetical protein